MANINLSKITPKISQFFSNSSIILLPYLTGLNLTINSITPSHAQTPCSPSSLPCSPAITPFGQQAVFVGHKQSVKSAIFSPDGKYILTASTDNTARLWDTKGNLLVTFQGHEFTVTSVTFSPDGKYILTASTDKTARLWDIQGKNLTVFPHNNSVYTATFSPDGKQILTTTGPSGDGKAYLWDTKGNLIQTLSPGNLGISLAIFSKNTEILTVNWDSKIRLWDSQGNLLKTFAGHESPYAITSIVFSPNGNQILSASFDKTARLWDKQGNILAVLQHENYVNSAIFSPDGKQILTASGDGKIHLWDIKGKLLAEFRWHESEVNSAVFSPDGKQILTASRDKTARLWNFAEAIASRTEQKNTLQNFQVNVSKNNSQIGLFPEKGIFSPDGKQILTNNANYTVNLWNIKGNSLAILRGHTNYISSKVFNPKNNQILTASGDKTARLWDKKGNILATFIGHQDIIFNAAFSPTGEEILTASWDKTARLWDSKGNIITVFPHQEWIRSAVFSPDGEKILTAGDDKIARLWDKKGNILLELKGHKQTIYQAVFSPDGEKILTVSRDRMARLWDKQGNLLAELIGHETDITNGIFNSDGSQILTASRDNTARLWDSKGNLLAVFSHGDLVYNEEVEEVVFSAVFSPDGKQILTGSSEDNSARLWDNKGNLLAVFRGHEGAVFSAVFSGDGKQILTTGVDKTTRLWDVEGAIATQTNEIAALQAFNSRLSSQKNNSRLAIFLGHEDTINSAVFNSNGSQILTASEDKTFRLWDTKGNSLQVFTGHQRGVNSAIFSPDNQEILTASKDNSAQLWDKTGNIITVFKGHENWVNTAVFSPDGQQILTASGDKTARLWDRKGNLLKILRGHEDNVSNGVFSPDGNFILTASEDKTAKLWDKQGNLLKELRGHTGAVNRAVFSPDGNLILTASSDNTVRIWDKQGNILSVIRGNKGWINSAIFSADGSRIIVANSQGIINIWDSQGKVLTEITGHRYRVMSAIFSPDGKYALSASSNSAYLWDVSAAIIAYSPTQALQENQAGTLEIRQNTIKQLEDNLKIYRQNGNTAKVAEILWSMGKIYVNFGQFQAALDAYNQALPLARQVGDRPREAAILNSLGELQFDLAEPQNALDYYKQALPIWYQLNDRGAVANTLNLIGNVESKLGKIKNALESYKQALTVARSAGNTAVEAISLMGIGEIYIYQKEWQSALGIYNQALTLVRSRVDQVSETIILNQFGQIYAALGDNNKAKEYYQQSLDLSQKLGIKTEEARILYNQAILNSRQKNLNAAASDMEKAIKIIENLRLQISSDKLRQSYFANNQDYYEFYIDLLMQLHQQDPTQGYDGKALHLSERARARTLLELLTEARADIRAGVDSKLVETEQNLQQEINLLEKKRLELLSRNATATEINNLQKKQGNVLKNYEDIKAKIRVNSPRYAALTQPQPLTLAEIQQQVLDDNTILLQYALGEERSYLWVVGKNSIKSYQLPSRSEIEKLGRDFLDTLTSPTTRNRLKLVANATDAFSKVILHPAAKELGNKRLLVVGDGILQYIPFVALNMPGKEEPLIVDREVINLPSISTLAVLRRDVAGRNLAPKTVAVLADPVFGGDSKQDDRLQRIGGNLAQNRGNFNNLSFDAQQLQRAASDAGLIWNRLPFTRQEAEAIKKLVPEGEGKYFIDFQANRTAATSPDLSQYRIVHFATHGFANYEQPELSGIVLSLFDEKGTVQNGYLRLHDIFNLNLPAELVVLSACQTGIGKQIKGEGLLGLTRGFMYAGAPRVVVSLWSVDDEGTATLMANFYSKMLLQKMSPAQALRGAMLEMLRQQNWRSPYYWAAFTLQGEWR